MRSNVPSDARDTHTRQGGRGSRSDPSYPPPRKVTLPLEKLLFLRIDKNTLKWSAAANGIRNNRGFATAATKVVPPTWGPLQTGTDRYRGSYRLGGSLGTSGTIGTARYRPVPTSRSRPTRALPAPSHSSRQSSLSSSAAAGGGRKLDFWPYCS